MLLMDNYGTPEKAPVFTVEFKIVRVGQSSTVAASSEQLPSRDLSPSGLATRIGKVFDDHFRVTRLTRQVMDDLFGIWISVIAEELSDQEKRNAFDGQYYPGVHYPERGYEFPHKNHLFFDTLDNLTEASYGEQQHLYPPELRVAVLYAQFHTCADKCIRDFATISGGYDFMVWEARQYAVCSRRRDGSFVYDINPMWEAERRAQLLRLLSWDLEWVSRASDRDDIVRVDPTHVPTLYATVKLQQGPLARSLLELKDLHGASPGDDALTWDDWSRAHLFNVDGHLLEPDDPEFLRVALAAVPRLATMPQHQRREQLQEWVVAHAVPDPIRRWSALVARSMVEFAVYFHVMEGKTVQEIAQEDEVMHDTGGLWALPLGARNPPHIYRRNTELMAVPRLNGPPRPAAEICRDASHADAELVHQMLSGERRDIVWLHACVPPMDDGTRYDSLTGGTWSCSPYRIASGTFEHYVPMGTWHDVLQTGVGLENDYAEYHLDEAYAYHPRLPVTRPRFARHPTMPSPGARGLPAQPWRSPSRPGGPSRPTPIYSFGVGADDEDDDSVPDWASTPAQPLLQPPYHLGRDEGLNRGLVALDYYAYEGAAAASGYHDDPMGIANRRDELYELVCAMSVAVAAAVTVPVEATYGTDRVHAMQGRPDNVMWGGTAGDLTNSYLSVLLGPIYAGRANGAIRRGTLADYSFFNDLPRLMATYPSQTTGGWVALSNLANVSLTPFVGGPADPNYENDDDEYSESDDDDYSAATGEYHLELAP